MSIPSYVDPSVYIGNIPPKFLSPRIDPEFRFRPDWAAFKAELHRLYTEACLRDFAGGVASPSALDAIRARLAQINLAMCQAAGLPQGCLEIQTDVEHEHGELHLHFRPRGLMAEAFATAPAPEALASPVEPLSWDGWPLGAPEAE